MAVMKEFAAINRVCPKHGPFYQDREFFASEAFDECPECEREDFERECFEEATGRLNAIAQDAEEFARRDATALEAPTIQQALTLLQVCLTWRRANVQAHRE